MTMPNLRIHKKHGFIIGGVCDKSHQRRHDRENAAKDLWEELLDTKSITVKKRILIINTSKFNRTMDKRIKRMRSTKNPEGEIGVYRFETYLRAHEGKRFPSTIRGVMKHIDAVTAPDFMKKTAHQDVIYRQRRKEGDFSLPPTSASG